MVKYLSFTLFLFIGIIPIAAQEGTISKQVTGGILNGKALSLPKPPFPPAARAVGASGAVTVQVLIDEQGNVVSATAINGHPLLRAASVEAARGAKFSPTLLQGNPVKVSGVIVYNFVGQLYPAKMGYTLAFAAETGTFDSGSPPRSFASQLSLEWAQEIAILKELTFEKAAPKVEPVTPNVEPSPTPATAKDPNRYTIVTAGPGFRAAATGDKLDERSVTAVRNLMPQFAARLQPSEAAVWSFELGQALGEFVAKYDDAAKSASGIAKIESIADRAPATAIKTAVQRVKDFVAAAKAPDAGDRNFRDEATSLANLRY